MSKKSKKKYYVVWKGKKPGIYYNWEECQKQINGFKNAKYKSFKSIAQAQQAFKKSSKQYIGKQDYEADTMSSAHISAGHTPAESDIQ